jgi:hypothetical protein
MPTNTEKFLERATAGLATDPELRLDVRAELRSHVADKADELGGEEHADEAIAALGEVVELAEEVAEANRRRLGWRGLARRILRFGLVPVAVVCAFVFSDFSLAVGLRQFVWLSDGAGGKAPNCLPAWLAGRTSDRSEKESLILNGDPTRTGPDRYRTLWERSPTNRVYYADYITRRLVQQPASGDGKLLAELAHAPTVDPDNARYPFLAAICRAEAAAELLKRKAGKEEIPPEPHALRPIDRPALDKAMTALLAATNMPEFRCHQWEMLREKVEVLGSPERLLDVVEQTAIAASVLLPDLQKARNAARYSLGYADLLITEGKQEEAIPFLHLPEALGRHVTQNSSCLIELLVSDALMKVSGEAVPRALREIGHVAEAAAEERRLAAIRESVQEWHEARKQPNPDLERLLNRRAGMLSHMLLPSLGSQDTTGLAAKLENGRRLEFTVLAKAIVSVLGFLLLAAMLACSVVALRWRLTLGSHAAPLLLLPSWRDMVRFVLLGVVAPFVVFVLWTRLLPFSGHAYSPQYAWHRTLAELLTLASALLLLPAWLAARSFRRRCLELDLAPPPSLPKVLRWWLILAGTLVIAGFLVPLGGARSVQIGTALAGAGGVWVAATVLCTIVLALLASRPKGRALGTLSRSLIPVLALATLVLSVAGHPILRAQERHLLRTDEILWVGDEPGLTRIENELTQRLRKATLKAMAENPPPNRQAQEGR